MMSRPQLAKVDADGLNFAYGEAGPQSCLKLLLIHGTHREESMGHERATAETI
jgi:hypothetical protein